VQLLCGNRAISARCRRSNAPDVLPHRASRDCVTIQTTADYAAVRGLWPLCFAAGLASAPELHTWSLTPFPHPHLNLHPKIERSSAIDLVVGPRARLRFVWSGISHRYGARAY
jgi:hypothetical protein